MDILALHVTFSPMELFFMGLCVLLLLFSRPLLGRIFSEEDEKKFRGRLNLFRLACLMALILLLSGGVARSEAESPWFTRLLGLLLVVYSAYLVFYLLSRLILRRFGRERQRNEQTVYVETYSSRLLTIIAGVVIVVVTLVAIIRILGYSTLLEAGGVLGVLGVMLALTQGSWVPDLVGGLVILNSRLRGMTVHNLSRFASARGLRESLVIKVSYRGDGTAGAGALRAGDDRSRGGSGHRRGGEIRAGDPCSRSRGLRGEVGLLLLHQGGSPGAQDAPADGGTAAARGPRAGYRAFHAHAGGHRGKGGGNGLESALHPGGEEPDQSNNKPG